MATTVGRSARGNMTITVKRNCYTLHILQTAKSWSTKHVQPTDHTIQARLHKVGHLNITRFIYCPKLQDPRAQGIHDRRTTRFNRNYINHNAPWLTHFDPLPDGLKTASLACVARVPTAAVPCVFQQTQYAEAHAKYQKLGGVGRGRSPASSRTDAPVRFRDYLLLAA